MRSVLLRAVVTMSALMGPAGIAHAQEPESALVRGETWSASPVVFGASRDTAEQQPAGPPPTPRHTGIKAMTSHLFTNFKYLPSVENLYWAGAGGALALGAHPFDAREHRARRQPHRRARVQAR
jgi:hypothetical protein